MRATVLASARGVHARRPASTEVRRCDEKNLLAVHVHGDAWDWRGTPRGRPAPCAGLARRRTRDQPAREIAVTEERSSVRRLVVVEYVSLDGVIQAPGHAGEDRDR